MGKKSSHLDSITVHFILFSCALNAHACVIVRPFSVHLFSSLSTLIIINNFIILTINSHTIPHPSHCNVRYAIINLSCSYHSWITAQKLMQIVTFYIIYMEQEYCSTKIHQEKLNKNTFFFFATVWLQREINFTTRKWNRNIGEAMVCNKWC